MTDRQGALGVLANSDAPERAGGARRLLRALSRQCAGARQMVHACRRCRPATTRSTAVEALAGHPDFTLANPNRLRSLVGAFAANQRAFHDASGRGYRFLADMILAVDKLNPQTAAKLVPPLGRWRRFDEARAALMRAELERIVATAGTVEGRVRTGVEEPGLNSRIRLAADPGGDVARDLVGGLVERRRDVGRAPPRRPARAPRSAGSRPAPRRARAPRHRPRPLPSGSASSPKLSSWPVRRVPGSKANWLRIEHDPAGARARSSPTAAGRTAPRAARPIARP